MSAPERDSWPQSIWDSAWLRCLDERARRAIEATGRLRTLDQGSFVFRIGQQADSFFVVGEGLVDLRAIRRGEQHARSLRRLVAGDALGEEALVRAGMLRAAEASCMTPVVVAEVPIAVFRRAVTRVGCAEAMALEEPMRRAATRDALRSSSLALSLPEQDIEAFVSAAGHRLLARGEVLFASGEAATHAYVVADGMVSASSSSSYDGKAASHVRAYLSRGDLVADVGFDDGSTHEVTVTACGQAWVISLPRDAVRRIARRLPEALEQARRLATSPPLPATTRHVLGDLWRFAEAGSMLVIDDELCVRCGHCAWSCADAHGDGVSRLVRRGEKVVVRDAEDGQKRALLVPGSCQHCKHPACMVDCPTGAIGRDPRGSVFVREDLCVGCGRCVTACPWGSVQMAPRPASARRRLPLVASPVVAADSLPQGSADVAVKCDLCRDLGHGPACVSACPVDAIARIDPAAALGDVQSSVGAPHPPQRGLPRPTAAWPWILGAVAAATAAARIEGGHDAIRLGTGIASGSLVVALAAYSLVKRTRLGRSPSPANRIRTHAVAHMALGTLALGTVYSHAGLHVAPNVAGALLLAFIVASVTGSATAVVYRLVPRALSRIERRALLAEDIPRRRRDLDERSFGAITGRSDGMKAVYARWLGPYARRWLGAWAMIASGRSLHGEERHLRASVEKGLGEQHRSLDGLGPLISMAVERRALRAQAALQWLLRACLPAHVVAVVVAIVLLAFHVFLASRGR